MVLGQRAAPAEIERRGGLFVVGPTPLRAAFQVVLKRRPDFWSMVFTGFQGFHRLA